VVSLFIVLLLRPFDSRDFRPIFPLQIPQIGIDYFQVLAIFASARIAWPELIRQMFQIMSAFNLNIELTAPECVVPSLAYQGKWLAFMVLPVIVAVFFGILHVAKLVYKRCVLGHTSNLNGHLPQLISVLLVFGYVACESIHTSVFSALLVSVPLAFVSLEFDSYVLLPQT